MSTENKLCKNCPLTFLCGLYSVQINSLNIPDRIFVTLHYPNNFDPLMTTSQPQNVIRFHSHGGVAGWRRCLLLPRHVFDVWWYIFHCDVSSWLLSWTREKLDWWHNLNLPFLFLVRNVLLRKYVYSLIFFSILAQGVLSSTVWWRKMDSK